MDPEVEQRADPSTAEIAEAAVRRIATAIVIAAALVALAIYARPGPPRFQMEATPGGVLRIDTRSGTIIGCDGGSCRTLLKRGQKLVPRAGPNTPARTGVPSPPEAPEPPVP